MVLEWLHQGCDGDLGADFPFQIPLKRCSKIAFFLKLWRRDPGFGAAISAAIMYVKASLCKIWLCVKACSVQKLLRAKLLCVVCKSLLCVKGSACKNFCVPKLLCVKSSLCKNFSM